MSAEIDHAILMSYDAMRICMGQSPVNATVSEVIRWMQVISGEPDRIAELEKERNNCCLCGEPILYAVDRAQLVADFLMHAKCWRDKIETPKARIAELEKDKASLLEFFEANPSHLASSQVTIAARNAELEAEVARLREDAASACESKAEEIDRICKVEGTESASELNYLMNAREWLRQSARILRAAMSSEGK